MANKQGRLVVLKIVGAELRFNDGATDNLTESLDDLVVRANDLQQPNREFGEYIINRHIPLQFQQQGTPKKWKPLNATYAAWKRKHYGNMPILIRTGAMRAGFKSQVTPRTLRITNSVKAKGGKPYWQYHQEGTDNMPQRMLIQMVSADRDIYRGFVIDHLIHKQTGGVR